MKWKEREAEDVGASTYTNELDNLNIFTKPFRVSVYSFIEWK